jgi:hypothetical protein
MRSRCPQVRAWSKKRLVDVALRHGFNAFTLSKWRAILSIEHEFSAALGNSIYAVLAGMVENTFGFSKGHEIPAFADGVLIRSDPCRNR